MKTVYCFVQWDTKLVRLLKKLVMESTSSRKSVQNFDSTQKTTIKVNTIPDQSFSESLAEKKIENL